MFVLEKMFSIEKETLNIEMKNANDVNMFQQQERSVI
jgi:hypothetical protein